MLHENFIIIYIYIYILIKWLNKHLSLLKNILGKMNSHFVEPDHYLVSYWPGTTPNDAVQTIKTDS